MIFSTFLKKIYWKKTDLIKQYVFVTMYCVVGLNFISINKFKENLMKSFGKKCQPNKVVLKIFHGTSDCKILEL